MPARASEIFNAEAKKDVRTGRIGGREEVWATIDTNKKKRSKMENRAASRRISSDPKQ